MHWVAVEHDEDDVGLGSGGRGRHCGCGKLHESLICWASRTGSFRPHSTPLRHCSRGHWSVCGGGGIAAQHGQAPMTPCACACVPPALDCSHPPLLSLSSRVIESSSHRVIESCGAAPPPPPPPPPFPLPLFCSGAAASPFPPPPRAPTCTRPHLPQQPKQQRSFQIASHFRAFVGATQRRR